VRAAQKDDNDPLLDNPTLDVWKSGLVSEHGSTNRPACAAGVTWAAAQHTRREKNKSYADDDKFSQPVRAAARTRCRPPRCSGHVKILWVDSQEAPKHDLVIEEEIGADGTDSAGRLAVPAKASRLGAAGRARGSHTSAGARRASDARAAVWTWRRLSRRSSMLIRSGGAPAWPATLLDR
jgi:hypothetical protein